MSGPGLDSDDQNVSLSALAAGARAIGHPLSREQEEQFDHYLALLLEWNRRINLTAIRDPEGIQIRHFLDSISCATVTGNLNDLRLIDIGTGAGFPGVPLKILYPKLELTLVESSTKKATFLNALVADLNISSVSVVVGRAEELGRSPAHREHYD